MNLQIVTFVTSCSLCGDGGAEGINCVECLIDADNGSVQFYAITSAEKGCGRKMVEAVLSATAADWFLAVPTGWSGGFWEHMAHDHLFLSAEILFHCGR